MKERLDILLVNKGLASSREKAKALIMSGIVYVDNQKEDKAGSLFDENAVLEIRGETLKYVSRGGLKLDKAVRVFNLNFDGFTCLDIGASTGGFTDVMLQNGASKVYSVDVGHGQLDWKLRNDERVVCMEKCNFRYVTDKEIPEKIDFASTDVSFISLTKILIPAYNLLKKDALMVCLIKPQFETTKEKVGKKGVVRDPEVHKEVIEKVIDFCLKIGFTIEGLDYSPIKGPEGNIEYLLLIKKIDDNIIDEDKALLYKDFDYSGGLTVYKEIIDDIVKKSHSELSV
ncbi:MAG: TlyA family RNA methyltransferase [Lachnospiraceae bacterium]|nr:TlyA family RNA methyltransferase [Lachnospiraceae bacterium]